MSIQRAVQRSNDREAFRRLVNGTSLDQMASFQPLTETDLWARLFDVPNRLYGATINNEGDAI